MDTHLRSDAMLMEILQDAKTITGFLDAIFGFLRRNTDFYHIKNDASEKIGFEKGVREQILFSAMQRYDPECKLNYLISEEGNVGDNVAPPALEEIEVETEDAPEMFVAVDDKSTMADKTMPTLKRMDTFAPADYKNGALYESNNYCWSQTLKDIEMQIRLPTELQSAKLLNIDIQPDSITVTSKDDKSQIIASGQLSNKYKYKDVVWTIAEGKLLISFDKAKECWWEKLFTSEKTINLKELDCERYIDELPEESQVAIQKLRVQQIEQDKNENRPETTQHDSSTLERLRRAWDADGSPFRGQPFDPSLIQFS